MATKIEWTDATWNPTTGCDRVSAGCDHCYALTLAKRLKAMGNSKYQRDGDLSTSGPGFGLTVHEDTLELPLRWRKPRRVFVNSMSDLFHKDVPDWFIARVWAVMATTPQHIYQVLTKRHGRMRSIIREDPANLLADLPEQEAGWLYNADWPLPNVHLGVSVEDQKRASLRIPALCETPAAARFLSCEPLLGELDLTPWLTELRDVTDPQLDAPDGSVIDGMRNNGAQWVREDRLSWVIIGGESGPGARPMHPDWARSLRDQCTAAGVPFFFKQWGAWAPWLSHPEGEDGPGDVFVNPDGETGHVWYSEHLGRPTNYAGPWGETSHIVSRVGKNAAGRHLDGRTWDEYPAVAG